MFPTHFLGIKFMKTTLVQEDKVTRAWHLVDAAGKPAGRLAVEIANVLRGKNKVTFSPAIDGGDFVLVINAEKVALTGNKESKKVYQHFTGYLRGRKTMLASEVRAKNPTRIIEQAVKGMMPRNHQSTTQLTRLKVFAGSEHPHVAQKPQPLEV